jgi:DNA ligase-1
MTLLSQVVETSQRVSGHSGRNNKIRELANLLRLLQADEIDIAVHYLSGDLPQGRIGLGYATVRAATAGPSAAQATLSILDVDRHLSELATIRGAGSTGRRAAALEQLFSSATEPESSFLVRLLGGELRQGALVGVMIDATAAAAELPVEAVRRAAMYCKSLGTIARTALLEGLAGLAAFRLVLFEPLYPMLAQTAVDVGDALEQLAGPVVFEWKMDGARIQAHKDGDTVRLYTRSLNEVTDALPEIVEAVRAFPNETLVLDGEAIAMDAAGRPHPFQITMRRFGRKLNVAELRTELPIQAFFFDCLYVDGQDLASRPTRERHDALLRIVPAAMRFPSIVTTAETEAQTFYDGAIAAGHEGVMAKSLESPYEAGNRGAGWLKIKRTHTLDLVVLAAEWGHGRRAGLLSNLHLGAWDPARGSYVMLGKTFKGLTDATLAWQTQEFLARETHRDAGTVYVRPELVAEIAFNDFQASNRYPGGLALRLARLKRYRADKRAQDADTMDTVRTIAAATPASD